MEKLILIGGGGHCASCMEVLEREGRFEVAAVLDLPEKLGKEVTGGVLVTATQDDLPALICQYKNILITIGQVKSAETRKQAYEAARRLGAKFPVITSPFSIISASVKLGAGSIVMHQALVNSRSQVGDNTIINTRALIEHDVILGDHCHISTAAVLNGGCRIGNGSFIGSSAVLREGVRVGDGSVVGCGTIVLADVPDNTTAYGVWKG